MSDSLIPPSITGKGSQLPARRQRARPRLRRERPVHARRRGGVHAPRRRDVRPRPAHRHRARRGRRTRARAAHQLRADAVGARGRHAGLPHARGRAAAAAAHPPLRHATSRARRACASARPARIRSRSSSAQRITAKDRYRAMVDQMQYIARRELIFGMHVHVAVDDPEKAIQVVNGADRPPPGARRALRELAVLARRADRAPLLAPHGLRRLPALGPAAALPRLRRLRAGREPAREDGLHPGLHAHLVGHPPPPAARHDRDPDLRRRDAARRRDRDHRVLPGARQALRGARRARRGDPLLPPHPHDREQVARRALRALGTGDGPPHGPPQPHPGGCADPPDAEDAAPARARPRLGGGARGHRGDPAPRQRRRPPAPRFQREPRHRRGRAGDRGGDGGRAGRSQSRRPLRRIGSCSRSGRRRRSRRWCGRRRASARASATCIHDRPLLLVFYLFDWSST